MSAPINTTIIPRFNPIYEVYFIQEADCVFFADEYPHSFQFISNPTMYKLLLHVNNKRSLLKIARKSGIPSIEKTLNLFSQLNEQQLVLFS